MTPAHILVLRDPGREALRLALEPYHHLCFVETVAEALSRLRQEPCDLIVSRVYLEDEDVFELLRQVKEDKRFAAIPVVCFAGSSSAIAKICNDNIEKATKSMGAVAFLDINDYCSSGLCNYAAIREAVEDYLPSPARKD